MKFLCPSCKAKYQLADEKVLGRSVRMRCRKCGHMIQISARGAIQEPDGEPTSEGDRSSTTPEPPISSLPASKGGSWAEALAAPAEPEEDETTAIVQPKTIAAAMAAAKRAAATPEEPAADGWFVGINGVPVGPIRLSELRSKAATGAITPESLTWREGLDEWRPLRTFPELSQIVEHVQAEALRAAERIAKARSDQLASANRSTEATLQARQVAATRVAELALSQANRLTPAPAPVSAKALAVAAAAEAAAAESAVAESAAATQSATAAEKAAAQAKETPPSSKSSPVGASPPTAPPAKKDENRQSAPLGARPPRPGPPSRPGVATAAKSAVTPPAKPGVATPNPRTETGPVPGSERRPSAVSPPSTRTPAPPSARGNDAAVAVPAPASVASPPAPAAQSASARATSSGAEAGRASTVPAVVPSSPSIADAPSSAPKISGTQARTVPAATTGADLLPAMTPSAATAPVAPSSPFSALSSFGVRPSAVPGEAATPVTLGGSATLHVAAAPLDSSELASSGVRSSTLKRVAMGAALLAFGLGAGFFLFSPGRASEPASAGPKPSAVAVAERSEPLPSIPPPEPVASEQTPALEQPDSGKDESKNRTRSTRPVAKPEPEMPSKLTGDLKNLGSGPAPTEGPRADPVSPPTTGGRELGAGQLQSTVARYTGGVKRSCWQPALDTRDKDAPTSARVNVTITVGPSGSVQDVSTSGDPRGYPGLANCIAGRVRGWQFPPAGAATTLNVPFVFAAQ